VSPPVVCAAFWAARPLAFEKAGAFKENAHRVGVVADRRTPREEALRHGLQAERLGRADASGGRAPFGSGAHARPPAAPEEHPIVPRPPVSSDQVAKTGPGHQRVRGRVEHRGRYEQRDLAS
jgi:hypothetical protein